MNAPFRCVLYRLCFGAGLAAVGLLSVPAQSAAHMFLWPWCVVYVAFCGLGWLSFILASRDGLPLWRGRGRVWLVVPLVTAAGAVACTLLSPFRAEIGIWLLVPLGAWGWFFAAAGVFSGRNSQPLEASSFSSGLPVALGLLGAALSCASLVLWGADQAVRLEGEHLAARPLPESITGWLAWWFAARNHQPLGHVNYTGGTALLFLPWLVWLAVTRRWPAAAAVTPKSGASGSEPDSRGGMVQLIRPNGFHRLASSFWLLASLLCFVMLLSSGSRGAWLGSIVAAVGVGALVWRLYPVRRRWVVGWSGAGLGLVLLLALLHPALRSSLRPRALEEIPNASNAERRSMLAIGWQMGLDRPLTGWGVGSVPLVYERYRKNVDYGPINMLQVHSTPLNLWAEGGVFLVGATAALTLLCLRAAWRTLIRAAPQSRELVAQPCWPAAISLLGYGVFALTDYQLDLPVVAFVVATNCGVLAAGDTAAAYLDPVPPAPARRLPRWWVAGATAALLLGLGFVAAPWLSARRALAAGRIDEAIRFQPYDTVLRAMRGLLAAEQARATSEAIEREQLRQFALNELAVANREGAHTELVQFNLGWLSLEQNPARSSACFRAVLAISPARSGASLGLALARLKLGDVPGAEDSLAQEILANPGFLASGWWLDPSLSPHRAAVLQCLDAKLGRLLQTYPAGRWPAPQARYFRTLIAWLRQEAATEELLAGAVSTEQHAFWAAVLAVPVPEGGDSLRHLSSLVGDREAARGRLALQVRRILGRPVDLTEIDGLLAALDFPAAEAFVREALQPEPGRPWPVLLSYARRSGFGVRQRNPYVQRVYDGMPELRSPLAETFVHPALLPVGWLYDRDLRALADCEHNESRDSYPASLSLPIEPPGRALQPHP